MAKKVKKSKAALLNNRKKEFLTDEESNAHRLVSQSKLKELAKTIDPEIRMDKKVHGAMVKLVAQTMVKAITRCYDNKRKTIRPSDV